MSYTINRCVVSGYVYVLTNSCMPGIVKVGRTTRKSEDRGSELYTTGVPVPFEVAYEIFTLDNELLEAAIHKDFKDLRVNENREFFRADVSDIKEKLEEWHEIILATTLNECFPDRRIFTTCNSLDDEEAALEARLAEIKERKRLMAKAS